MRMGLVAAALHSQEHEWIVQRLSLANQIAIILYMALRSEFLAESAALSVENKGSGFEIGRTTVEDEFDATLLSGNYAIATVPFPGFIFADGFESGNTLAWSAFGP